jgi:hypothetical protein
LPEREGNWRFVGENGEHAGWSGNILKLGAAWHEKNIRDQRFRRLASKNGDKTFDECVQIAVRNVYMRRIVLRSHGDSGGAHGLGLTACVANRNCTQRECRYKKLQAARGRGCSPPVMLAHDPPFVTIFQPMARYMAANDAD